MHNLLLTVRKETAALFTPIIADIFRARFNFRQQICITNISI